MTFKWSRLSVFIFLLILLLIGLAYLWVYSQFISPLQKEVEQSRQQVELQQELITMREQGEINDTGLTTDLQRMLPIQATTDQLLVLLTEVETASNSTINQISITTAQATDPVLTNMGELSANTFQLQVTSPSYNEMFTFIEQLQQMTRLTNMGEIQFRQGAMDEIEYSLSFSAYYSPALSDLLIEAPSYK